MTQVPSVLLPHIERAYRPNEVGKRDPDGATFVAEATGKAYPGLFANVGGVYARGENSKSTWASGQAPVHFPHSTQ
jgi:hypothetical protein